MDITVIQTSDPRDYVRMLELTSLTVKEFVRRKNLQYEYFTGLRRGYFNWHASYNRISIIRDNIRRKPHGWILYMDADCFVSDLNFDVRNYLSDKTQYAFIFTRSGAEPDLYWNINNGVFFINLGHPVAQRVMATWEANFYAIPDADLRLAGAWDDVTNDQTLLHQALASDAEAEQAIYFDHDKKIINTPIAMFVRHIMRATQSDIDRRVSDIELAVTNVFLEDGQSHRME